jgi:hypothetical protein
MTRTFTVEVTGCITCGVLYERGTSPHCTTYKKIPFNMENLK